MGMSQLTSWNENKCYRNYKYEIVPKVQDGDKDGDKDEDSHYDSTNDNIEHNKRPEHSSLMLIYVVVEKLKK